MKRWAVFLVIPLLAACASIPTTSQLYVLDEVSNSPASDRVRVIARPPAPSMSPQELIDGFIAAQASISDNFAIAREYLSDNLSLTWQPSSVHLIDGPATQFTSLSATATMVKTQELGVLDESARLTWWNKPITGSDVFAVESTPDGYRLSRVPNQIYMSALDFARSYVSVPLYFLNSDYTSLVPDIVWIANVDETVATRVMQLLLQGPNGALKSAEQTAIPSGTNLAPTAVTLAGGEASLNLDSRALQVTDAQRAAMVAQITWSLTALSRVNAVRITVANQAVSTEKFVFSRRDFPALAPDQLPISKPLFSVTGSRLVRGVSTKPDDLGQLASAQVIALSRDGSQCAYVTSGDAFVAPVSAPTARTRLLTGVVDLDFDASNRLWMVTANGRVWIRDGVRPPQRILSLPTGQRVVAISNSPDGARVAMVLEGADGQTLRIFGVSTTGTSVALSPSIRVEQSLSAALDVAWLDSLQLVVVGQLGVEQPAVYRLNLLAFQTTPLGGPSGIAQLSAVYGQPPAVLTSQGVLWIVSGNQWQSIREASAIAYAG